MGNEYSKNASTRKYSRVREYLVLEYSLAILFFIFNYSSTREYSKRVLLEANRHLMMIYYFFLFILNDFMFFMNFFFGGCVETKDLYLITKRFLKLCDVETFFLNRRILFYKNNFIFIIKKSYFFLNYVIQSVCF